MNTGKPHGRLVRALTYAGPHRLTILVILSLTLLSAGIGAVEPLVMKFIFDALDLEGSLAVIFQGVGMLVGLHLVREIASGFSNWLTWRTRLSIQAALLESTVDRLHRMPLHYHRDEGVGALMTRLDRGIQGFVGAITEISFNIVPSVAYLATSLVIMVGLEWRLSLVAVFFAPIPALIAAFASPAQVTRERHLMETWTRLYARFNEVLTGLVTVRSFAMEDEEKHRFISGVRGANRVVSNGVRYDSFVGFAQNITTVAARIASIALGAYLIATGDTTLGTLVAFISYTGGLFGPVQGLTGTYRTLRLASVSLDLIFDILDTQETLGDEPGAVDAGRLQGEVIFRNVEFSYEPGKVPLLRDISFHVKPGELIAIVGPSGAGKTTIMALLQRFYDPQRGEVLVDGIDIRRLKQKSIRRQIGVVLQDAHMFNDTVRNNIAYGKPEASFDEITAAAKAANAHEFIMRLPKRYDTKLGERAGRLSAGERQRIAIARALVKDPPLLILDEATSALDAELEALVQQALERLVKGRTTFAIAHRLATVVNADRILVLKNGTIMEAGSHRELIAMNGYYASLVSKQTKGLILTEP